MHDLAGNSIRESWTATIPGEPIGKGRPRATSRGGRVRTFTPKKTRAYEQAAARVLADGWHREPLRGAVRLFVVALFPRPGRMMWKRKPMPRTEHTARPDGDNVLKIIQDSLEKSGVLLRDQQVFQASITKLVCAGDEQPCVQIRLCWSDPCGSI